MSRGARFLAARRVVAVLFFATTLAACAGRDFKRPGPEGLALGTTSPADVVRALGEPYEQRTRTITGTPPGGAASPVNVFSAVAVNGSYTTIVYTFADAAGAPLVGGISPGRTLAFGFRNDRLIHYSYSSSFAADSTNFDETKIGRIEKGKTTQREIREWFGEPSGRAIFPEILALNGEKYMYSYSAVWPMQQRAERKRLEIVFEPGGTVVDFQYLGDALPVRDFSSAALISLVMPRQR